MARRRKKDFLSIPFTFNRKNYLISADEYQYILSREEEGNWINIGYFTRLDILFKSLFERSIRESKAKTLVELKNVIESRFKELSELLKIFNTEKIVNKLFEKTKG